MSIDDRALSETASARVLARLFAELLADLSTERGRSRMIERYGAETCASVREIVHGSLGAPRPPRPSHAGVGNVGGGDPGSWTRG